MNSATHKTTKQITEQPKVIIGKRLGGYKPLIKKPKKKKKSYLDTNQLF